MPELPEVETIRRHLAPHVERRVLETLDVEDPRWCEPLAVHELRDAVEGRVVERLGRRGKYLVWELADEVFLLVHLRMTGTLLLDPAPGVLYRRVRFALSGERELAFCDPRRFGTGQLVLGSEALEAFFATRVGLEPLGPELTGEALRDLARGRRAPIKAFLLDQRRGEPCVRCGSEIVKFVAAGRGTYCCETCQKRPRALRRKQLAKPARAVGLVGLAEAPDHLVADDDLRE